MIGGIVLGYIWQFLFNNFLVSIGQNLSLQFLQTSFLSRPEFVIWAMSAVNTWQYAGYLMLIYVASIQSIPASLTEAAEVDGASYLRRVIHIQVPMMANAFTISLFLTLTTSFKQFDMNFTLTNGGPATRFMGAPVKASQLLAMNIFHTATANRMAEAQAKAVVLFISLVVVALIQVAINKKKRGGNVMSTIGKKQPSGLSVHAKLVGGNSRKTGKIILEVVTVTLFLLFMVPFILVILNSAKTSREIIFNAIALPTDWGQIFTNIFPYLQ